MTKRVFAAVAVALIAAGVAGCGRETKPSLPTELIEPPPPDKQGATSGGKGKKSAPKHSDTGDQSGSTDDK
jgi:hypothetical protein